MDPAQAAEIRKILKTHAWANQIHLKRIRAIFKMPGYLGSTECGMRASNSCVTSGLVNADTLHGLADSAGVGGTSFDEDTGRLDDTDGGLNDDTQDELRWMGQFIEDIAVASEVDNSEEDSE